MNERTCVQADDTAGNDYSRHHHKSHVASSWALTPYLVSSRDLLQALYNHVVEALTKHL